RCEPDLQAALVPGNDDLPRLPVHAPGARVERAGLVPRPPRLSGRAHDAQPKASCQPTERGSCGVMAMTCSLHQAILPKGKGVRVNGVAIARDAIAREAQHHPARTPLESWKAAARALVVRELLRQEARRLAIEEAPLADAEGRRETAEEAAVRALVA